MHCSWCSTGLAIIIIIIIIIIITPEGSTQHNITITKTDKTQETKKTKIHKN